MAAAQAAACRCDRSSDWRRCCHRIGLLRRAGGAAGGELAFRGDLLHNADRREKTMGSSRLEVKDYQRRLASLDAAHRRAVAQVEGTLARRAELVADQDARVDQARCRVETAVVDIVAAFGVPIPASRKWIPPRFGGSPDRTRRLRLRPWSRRWGRTPPFRPSSRGQRTVVSGCRGLLPRRTRRPKGVDHLSLLYHSVLPPIHDSGRFLELGARGEHAQLLLMLLCNGGGGLAAPRILWPWGRTCIGTPFGAMKSPSGVTRAL